MNAAMETYELVVIGAGPAGLAAAGSAAQAGAKSVLLLERNDVPGGILNQCIHDGFGVERFSQSLSGPEYVQRFLPALKHPAVTLKTSAMVLSLSPERVVTYADRAGLHSVLAGAVVLATGCRERTRGNISVPGARPAGVFTAGVVQRLVNVENVRVGSRAVILGSGDIGLIMARRLTLEGMEVVCVLEKLPYCSGLLRNVRQCLQDYGIPLYLSTTVAEIHGERHVEAVVTASVDENGAFIESTRRVVPCDTLILSVGLIPENELFKAAGGVLDPATNGALVDGRLMTSIPGVFSCGNGLHVHDLVDMVSQEAERAAGNALSYARGTLSASVQISVRAENGIRYVLPRAVPAGEPAELLLRVTRPGRMQTVLVSRGKTPVASRAHRRLTPAEMLRVSLPAQSADGESLAITLRQDAVPTETAQSDLVCTVCPNGCALTVTKDKRGNPTIQGALCKRGVRFGLDELTDPRRTLTTTLRVLGGKQPLVPVRSVEPVPKAALAALVKALRDVTLTAPVEPGQAIPFDGASLVAAGCVEKLN